MKRRSRKINNVWLGAFILFAFLACYLVETNAPGYGAGRITYGEMIRRTTANQTSEGTESVMNQEEVEMENELARPVRKVAFLTFDDGPSENTKKVLDILEQYNIRATFFMVGEEITPEREDMIRKMVADGHLIGVHTYSHDRQAIYQSETSCIEDFMRVYNRIVEVTGVEPVYYRFPYGSANYYITGFGKQVISEMEKEGLVYYDWNVSAEDSVGKTTQSAILNNIKIFKKYNEPVILLHDGSINDLTAKTLPIIIEKIIAAGYEFDTIDHRSKPYQWKHNWEQK